MVTPIFTSKSKVNLRSRLLLIWIVTPIFTLEMKIAEKANFEYVTELDLKLKDQVQMTVLSGNINGKTEKFHILPYNENVAQSGLGDLFFSKL